MHDPLLFITLFSTFMLAGLVKGVIGLGFPTVVIGLLTAALDLTTAMALLIIPSLLTNAYQASIGGNGLIICARIWPFILMATSMVSVGASALTRIDLDLLSGILGSSLIIYAVVSLAGLKFTVQAHQEPWAGIALGSLNGIITGMTGAFLIPSTMYLQAIGLPRDMLVQAMGILFTALTISLAFSLQSNNLMAGDTLITSFLLIIPALAGMLSGSALRNHLSEVVFRLVFFSSLIILGFYIIIQVFF